MAAGFCLCLMLVAALWAPQQTTQASPVRDAAATPGKTSTVRGRITAASTGQPIHRVRISLNGAVQNAPTAVTNTRGEFEVVDVPPGAYTLTVTRSGYLTLQYGQRRPREAGRTLELAAGQLLEKVDMQMFRGAAIAGRITDEVGDPAAGVRVEAIEQRYIRGSRVAVPARIATANDAGEYRLSGLEPGSYHVRATSSEMWEAEDGKQTYAYGATLYPGVPGTDQAQSVTLAVGQDQGGVDFRMIAGRAARLTGVVEDTAGNPLADQAVNVDVITRTIGGALLSAGFGGRTKTDAKGGFDFAALAPGEYIVYTGATERVAVPAVLGEGDVQHVVLSPRKPTVVNGMVITDEQTPPPFPAGRLRIATIGANPDQVLPQWAAPGESAVRPDWTFRVGNVEGPHLFRVTNLPSEWMLRAVTLGGREITDLPLTLTRGAPDVDGLQVVLSRKGAKISGDVADVGGAPAPDVTVIVFAESPAQWGLGSRFVRATRPDDSGRFSIAGLPAAAYRIAARSVVADGQWEDREFLLQLMKDAVRVELVESGAATIKLTTGEGR